MTEKVIPVGDVMYDVALHLGALVRAVGRILGRLGTKPCVYGLATMHRAENSDDLCQ